MTDPSMCQAYWPATRNLSMSRNPCICSFIFWRSYQFYWAIDQFYFLFSHYYC